MNLLIRAGSINFMKTRSVSPTG